MDASFWPRLQAQLELVHLSARVAATYAAPSALDSLMNCIRAAYPIDGALTLVDGAAQGLLVALNACRPLSARVSLPRLGFPGYAPLATALGFEIETYEPCDLHPPRQGAGEVRRAIDSSTILVLSQPHNPTGHVYDVDHVEFLMKTARRRPVALIVDYGADFGSEVIRESLHREVGRMTAIPTLHIASLGKLLACPGLRLGAVWSLDARLIDAAAAFRVHLSRSPCPMAVTLATRLLESTSYLSEVQQAVHEVRRRRQWLHDSLSSKFSRMVLPQAGSFVFVPGLRCTELSGGATVPGRLFGDSGDSSVRLNTALGTTQWQGLQDHVETQLRS